MKIMFYCPRKVENVAFSRLLYRGTNGFTRLPKVSVSRASFKRYDSKFGFEPRWSRLWVGALPSQLWTVEVKRTGCDTGL